MIKSALVVASLVFAVGSAQAESKSWAQLKGKLPAGSIVVGSVDAGALRGTPSFGKVMEWIGNEDKDIKGVLELVKGTCGVELPAMFADVSFAIDAKEKGVVVVGLASGVDQTKATDCLTKLIAKVDPKMKLGTKAVGKLTEYSVGATDKLYAAWLAPDVVAIGIEENAHTALDAMLAGQAPSGDLATYLGKAGTSATAFAAFNVNDDGFKGGWATLTLGKNIALSIRMYGMTPKDGDKGRKEMADMKKKGLERSAKLPEMKKLFSGLKLGGKGDEVTLDLSTPEASLPVLLPAFDKVF